MLVKTLFPHSNIFGAAFVKNVGDEYDAPEETAAPLIDAGMVEGVPVADEPPARPRRGSRKQSAVVAPDQVSQDSADLGDGAPGQD